MAELMKGKRGLVMGVANERSIAWGIAKAMHEQAPKPQNPVYNSLNLFLI